MKTTNKLYTVLARYSTHSNKKIKEALKDVKHKTYITDMFAYIASVPRNELGGITSKLRDCNAEVNGRNHKVMVQYYEYTDVTPKTEKSKKPSNNSKSVAAKAKAARKSATAKKFETRSKRMRQKSHTHRHSSTNGQKTTLQIKRQKRINKVCKALERATTRKAARTQKKPVKSKVTEQTLKFAA